MEYGARWIENLDHEKGRYQRLEVSRCGYGKEWRESAGWSSGQVKRYYKMVKEKIIYRNHPKPR